MKLIGHGELSHAARNLQSNGIAAGNMETLREFSDPRLRPQHLIRPIPDEVLHYNAGDALQIDKTNSC